MKFKPHIILMNKLFLFIGICLILQSACKEKLTYLNYNDTRVSYTGRVELEKNETAELYWPGTSVKVRFKGTGLKVLLKDDKGQNYYNVITDADSIFILHPDSVKNWYTLASGLHWGDHTIELFKRTEWDRGNTSIYKFSTDGEFLIPEPKPDRSIEFFGNSITAGYGNEDYSGGDSPDSIFTNNYMSYAAITARHFNAEYYCTAKGGIGIMLSWFPMIMPEMFNRLNPTDPESKWDFSKNQPGIVVINLFQNDSWLVNMPDYPEFISRFGTEKPTEDAIIDSYRNFILKIREVYPTSSIICTLGSMDVTKAGSPWPIYVSIAVEQLDDTNIYTCFFPFKNTPGHPKVEEHEVMAKILIQYIEENIDW